MNPKGAAVRSETEGCYMTVPHHLGPRRVLVVFTAIGSGERYAYGVEGYGPDPVMKMLAWMWHGLFGLEDVDLTTAAVTELGPEGSTRTDGGTDSPEESA